MDAIRHALNVLSWFEMRDEDRPPRAIWMNPMAIGDHFDRVRDKYATPGAAVEYDADLDQNDLTKGLR